MATVTYVQPCVVEQPSSKKSKKKKKEIFVVIVAAKVARVVWLLFVLTVGERGGERGGRRERGWVVR